MSIRRVKTRTTDNGSSYYSYRLVDSYRVADRVRQRTLLNLGSNFSFPREQWPELTQRIEQILLGQQDFEYEKQGLSALYRASDLLWTHHEEIEDFLYKQHVALFEIEESITLYDLTNTFFEGTGKYNDHAAYGYSKATAPAHAPYLRPVGKERRNDCPLVTLTLVLDGSGFSRRSRIFTGNVSEPATLKKMIEQLRSPVDPNDKEQESGGDCEKNPLLDLRSHPTQRGERGGDKTARLKSLGGGTAASGRRTAQASPA